MRPATPTDLPFFHYMSCSMSSVVSAVMFKTIYLQHSLLNISPPLIFQQCNTEARNCVAVTTTLTIPLLHATWHRGWFLLTVLSRILLSWGRQNQGRRRVHLPYGPCDGRGHHCEHYGFPILNDLHGVGARLSRGHHDDQKMHGPHHLAQCRP